MQLWSAELTQNNVKPLIIGDVDTCVMEVKTSAHVASNPGQDTKASNPGKDTKFQMMKGAVPPVQTAASKTMMVKHFMKKKQNSSYFHFFYFLQAMSTAQMDQLYNLEKNVLKFSNV